MSTGFTGSYIRPKQTAYNFKRKQIAKGKKFNTTALVKKFGKLKMKGKKPAKKIHSQANELPNRSGTDSSLVIKLRPTGLLNKIQGKMINQTFNLNSGLVLSAGAGVQAVNFLPGINTPYDLQQLTGDAHVQSGSPYGVYSQNVFLKSTFAEHMIQNSTNAVVRIQIWDVMCRRDAYQDRTGAVLTPDIAMRNGIKDQSISGTGTEYWQVGARPTDSVLFNQFYKVKKVTYTDLAPGQIHYHRMHYKIMRKMNAEVANADSLNMVGFKGWTIYPVVVFYGGPVGDNVTASTTEACKLNTVSTKNYHFSFLSQDSVVSNHNVALLASTQVNLENLVTGTGTAYAAV